MKKIPYTIKATNTKLRVKNRKIPYIIVQTMKSNIVPINMYNAAMSWVKKNPEYDYEFFDNKRCIQFIKSNYSATVAHCFNMIRLGAAKADFFRWLYLYKKGGVYLDIDMVCKHPIRNFLYKNDDFVTRYRDLSRYRYRLNHNFIATIPRFVLLLKSIDNAINNILVRYKERKNEYMPQNICGPAVIGKTLNVLKNKNKYCSHANYKYNATYLKSYKIRFINKIIKKYVISKYSSYKSECKKHNYTRYRGKINAFDYKFANLYVQSNKVKLNFKLINGSFF